MTLGPVAASDAGRPERLVAWAAVGTAVPAAVWGAVLALPGADGRWENHPAHFWLVLSAALASVGLGFAVSAAARRRRDARLFLISLAFLSSAAFLGLHALATPGVLVGKNAGFELATPVGLVLAAAFAATSAFEASPRTVGADPRGGTGDPRRPRPRRRAVGRPLPRAAPAARRPACGGTARRMAGHPRGGRRRALRRRRRRLPRALPAARRTLRARGRVRVRVARRSDGRDRVGAELACSWWEWHVLMLASFATIAAVARVEWHEERFSALYLDRTLQSARDVSVLLADLSGFTRFAEGRDPAEVTDMLNTYFETIVPLLEAEGGEVHQIVGDEVMAIFNKQDDTPDHPARTGRAALALQAAAARISAAHDGWPVFRTGVNSGAVVAAVVGGASGHRKHGVVGDTVNIAARLEAAAAPGSVVAGAATVARLPPGVVVERLPPLAAKGKSEPLEAYVLRSLPS